MAHLLEYVLEEGLLVWDSLEALCCVLYWLEWGALSFWLRKTEKMLTGIYSLDTTNQQPDPGSQVERSIKPMSYKTIHFSRLFSNVWCLASWSTHFQSCWDIKNRLETRGIVYTSPLLGLILHSLALWMLPLWSDEKLPCFFLKSWFVWSQCH